MPGFMRWVGLGVGVLMSILAVGYFLQWPLATISWPWMDGRLTYIFVSSIMAAIAAPVIWISLSGEWGAAVGGGINLGLGFTGVTLFLLQLSAQPGQESLTPHAIGYGVFVLINAAIFLWCRRIPIRDTRPIPRLVRVSFVGFGVALVLTALALVFRYPTIFPWPLDPNSSVVIGWTFMGSAAYFFYGAFQPSWNNARGQLLGFLAYDLVLIVPFLQHFATVRPEHMLSLTLYTGVLIYSGALATYFLFVSQRTRTWAIQEA